MRLVDSGKSLLVLCAALLSACGVSVDKAMVIDVPGDSMSLEWSGAGKDELPDQAHLYRFRGKEYVLLENGDKIGGYMPLQIASRSAGDIELRALDPKRVAYRIKRMKLPLTYRKLWLRQEIYLEAGLFEKLLAQHEGAIFQKGVAVRMQKIKDD
ncbi:hypothetical protein ACFDR9_002309 [Janthinobacterium sp. CG_23.3]|uniref:hypothetical protein n=1 Tax=Janthinobacterium sp. CG3 TaxID=1075768 RepID=UPI0012FBD278|nr:hypothetical protein [Janthinobacterium sp. CG3]